MSGLVVWEGKSQLDKKPIVLIATDNSKNSKTGSMIQTWILRRFINPVQAIKTGQDESICGDCKFRGGICYVNVAQAPNQVYKTYRAGKYPKLQNDDYSFFKDKLVRFGAYGDCLAVPIHIWHEILAVAKSNTCYTHQWKLPIAQWYKEFSMASCDSEEEYIQAIKMGWRTFRVKGKNDIIQENEVICPASAEAGYKSTCAQCLLCGGTSKSAKNIVINSHGLSHKIKKFEELKNG